MFDMMMMMMMMMMMRPRSQDWYKAKSCTIPAPALTFLFTCRESRLCDHNE